jgi:hypothetical protein
MGLRHRKRPRRLQSALVAAVLCLSAIGLPAAAEEPDPDAAFRAQADALLNALRQRVADCSGDVQKVASVGSGGPTTEARPELRWNPQLAQAAARHAGAMARTRLFDHVGTDGTTVRERVNATGYRWQVIGENLAAGHAALGDALAGWLGSRSHCEAMIDRRFTEFGIARTASESPNDVYGVYWALVLGRPR